MSTSLAILTPKAIVIVIIIILFIITPRRL